MWMDFGIPGEAIGKALGGILGQKKGNKKNMEKKMEEGKPRRVARTSSEDFFGRETGTKGLTRPWPTLKGWAGGLHLFTLCASR